MRVRFPDGGPFAQALKARVAEYFVAHGERERDQWRMYVKSVLIFAWFGVSWALLVFGGFNFLVDVFLSISLGLAVAGIGFSVQHDANHGGYSRFPLVNRIFSSALDLLGASSYIWRY